MTGYTGLLPEEKQELSERGKLGALYSILAPHYDAWRQFHPDEDFELLKGPEEEVRPSLVRYSKDMWISIEELEGDAYVDYEADYFDYLDTLDLKPPPYVDHAVGKDFYFMTIDVLRRIVQSVSDWGRIRFLMDACDKLDAVMEDRVIDWHVKLPTYQKLFDEFMEAEARAVVGTPLLKVGEYRRERRVFPV
jgi:hypothetical protein